LAQALFVPGVSSNFTARPSNVKSFSKKALRLELNPLRIKQPGQNHCAQEHREAQAAIYLYVGQDDEAYRVEENKMFAEELKTRGASYGFKAYPARILATCGGYACGTFSSSPANT
jgi:hypothetical protein